MNPAEATPRFPTAPAHAWRYLSSACAALAAVTHVFSAVIAGVLTPDYQPVARAISELGMGGKPHRDLANLGGMVIPGALVAVAALAAAKVLPVTGKARLGLAAMAAAGLSLVLSGLIPYPSAIHLAAAVTAASACALSLLALSTWAAAYLGERAWAVSGLGCALYVALDTVVWAFSEGRGAALHAFMGLEQRAASFAAFTWWALCLAAASRRASAAIGSPPATPSARA